MVLVAESSRTAEASTVTLSLRLAHLHGEVDRPTWSTARLTCSRFTCLKPVASATIRYLPGSKAVMR